MTGLNARWAISFADLCLLLLGFFVLIHAQGRDPAVAAGVRAALGRPVRADRAEWPAARLFQPGEATLHDAVRRHVAILARKAASGGRRLRIDSTGHDPASGRFDGWELAAARVAAVARAARDGGMPAARIDVAMPVIAGGSGPQRIGLTAL